MWLRSQEKDLPIISGLVAAKSQPVRRQGAQVAQAEGVPAEAAASPTVRLDVDRSEVSDVLALIIEQTGANIVYRPEEVSGAISVRLRDASVEQSLDAVTRAAGLAFRKEGGTYYVGKPETIQAMFPVPTTNQVYTLKQALVADLTPILTRLFPQETGLNVMSQGTHLLVLTGPTEVVNQAMAMLPELDVPKVEVVVNPEEVETSVVQELKYLSQDNAAQVITQVIPGSALAAAAEEGATPGTTAPPAKLRVVKIPGPTLPVGASSGTSGTGSTSLLGTQPSSISTSSSGTSSTGSSVGNANKLLLLGQKGLVSQAVALLERVDVPLRQLRIEARVLDINRTKTSDHGFAWQIGQNLSFKEVLPGPVAGATTANPFRIGSFERTTPLAVDVAISAMVSDNKARVLAEPSIRVLDGVQGQIFIGDVLRFVVSQQSTPTGNVVQIGETNVGIGLNVVGRSSSDGYITLNLSPTVSIALTGQEGLPQTRSRSVSTTVRVKDGETIVIGGLFSEQDVNNASKVPILGDLPVLGNFFRSRNKNKVNSEVVIFLKTQILPADERAVAELRQ
jgi:type II secretory pathway component GspD/PulD (secretin)